MEKDLGGHIHKLQLEKAFKSNTSKTLLDTVKGMTGLSTTRQALEGNNEAQFANDLNTFFSRFDKGNVSHGDIKRSFIPMQSH